MKQKNEYSEWGKYYKEKYLPFKAVRKAGSQGWDSEQTERGLDEVWLDGEHGALRVRQSVYVSSRVLRRSQ